MQMYLFNFPTPYRDGDLDAEVFLHELTHGLSNRLHNNGSGLFTQQSAGMGEGWSDYYARCLLATADEDVDGVFSAGGYSTYLFRLPTFTDNYYYGIRRFPYAVKSNVGPNGRPHNPSTFADLDFALINALNDGAFPPSPVIGITANEVHNIGSVWCMALLEVRARLIDRLGFAEGNNRALQIVTDAMKLDVASPTITQARDSIIAADVALPEHGTGFAVDLRFHREQQRLGYAGGEGLRHHPADQSSRRHRHQYYGDICRRNGAGKRPRGRGDGVGAVPFARAAAHCVRHPAAISADGDQRQRHGHEHHLHPSRHAGRLDFFLGKFRQRDSARAPARLDEHQLRFDHRRLENGHNCNRQWQQRFRGRRVVLVGQHAR